MKNPVFTGAGVAIITPMYEDGSINFDELGRIIEDQIARSTDAIVICGTTGESPTMTDEEHTACIRYAVKKTAGRVPVIAGTGSICYGQSTDGREARSGGWGHLIDDEGSAYALGRDILRAVVRAADGRAPATALTELVAQRLGALGVQPVIRFTYAPTTTKKEIAALAPLLDPALQQGDAAAAAAMRKALYNVLRQEAKDIHDKYIEVPYTTNFGILFLPFEGLYAEVVSGGVTETLQRDYQITVAGPSTMAALLNALQMGFRTLAIQKRSGEVWTVLGAVKTEFEKFGTGLAQMQRHLNQTGSDLEELIGTRSRAITRKLESVQQLEDDTAREILGIGDAGTEKDNR